MSKPLQCNTRVMQLLTEKASIKQEVFRKSKDYFNMMKGVVESVTACVADEVTKVDDALQLEYKDNSPNECELHFSGDVLLFNMHTNVFTFDKNHRIWQSGYVREDKRRAYFAMINIYNFLADSFRYNRMNDAGLLLARVFVNREGQFFVEGKKQMSFIFNHLGQQVMDEANIKELVDTAMICSLEHDLTVPDYKDSMRVSVKQIQSLSNELQLKTAKKVDLGYYPRMTRG
ncbi:hypothetical protein [Owenweeksia hongkongensis]|uniref:hypothetical protein n=1 Tax=Owenweeksia hongkongensis TaxID=253245 RepID=UPI003A945176